MKRKNNSNMDEGSWLNTYADVVTLLLTFFILLYATSSMDNEKWEKIVNAFTKDQSLLEQITDIPTTDDVGGNADEETVLEQDDFDKLYFILKEFIEQNELESSMEVHKDDDYNFVVFKNNIFFDGDSSILKSDGKKILDYLCDGISTVTKSIGEIKILGHTAQARTDEKNNPETDRTLSTERANSVLLYMQTKNMIDPAKLVSVGYGQHRPLHGNSSEQSRIANRRVEILISKNAETDKLLDQIYESMNGKLTK